MGIYGNDIFSHKEFLIENYTDSPYKDDEYTEYINEAIDAYDGTGGKLRPVFIVCIYSGSNFVRVMEKFVKGKTYWHVSVGFGPALSKLYSFNFGKENTNRFKGGLSFESIRKYQEEHPETIMEVSCIFLTKYKYRKLQRTLDYYIEHKEKTKYDFINLFYSLFGHKTANGLKFNLVCSSFIDTILKSINVDLVNGLQSNLVKPDDFKVDENYKPKQFKIFEGKVSDYQVRKVIKKVEELSNNENSNYFKI